MFYMPPADLWRWKMNVARAMGNTRDEVYVPELAEEYRREEDERVKAMAAWALGRIGGPEARQWLDRFLPQSAGLLREEIIAALDASAPGKRSF